MNIEDVAVAVNTPRILIIAASHCQALEIESIIYPHVIIGAASLTALKMKVIKAEVNIVALCYSNNPGTVEIVVVVLWVVWTVEISVRSAQVVKTGY